MNKDIEEDIKEENSKINNNGEDQEEYVPTEKYTTIRPVNQGGLNNLVKRAWTDKRWSRIASFERLRKEICYP